MNAYLGALIGLALTPVPLAAGSRLRRHPDATAVAATALRLTIVATLMALTGAAVAASTTGVIGASVAALAALIAVSAATVDLAELRLPDVLTFTLIAGGVAAAVAGAATGQVEHPWLALLAGAGYALVMLLLALISLRGGYGLGDVKLAGGLGIWVGLDYPATVAGALLYGQLLILATLLVSYAAARRQPTVGVPPAEAPLGPALVAGAALAVLFTG